MSALLEYDNEGNLLHRHVTQQAHGTGTVMQQVTIDGASHGAHSGIDRGRTPGLLVSQ